MADRLRLGRSHADTVYLQTGDQPDDNDPRVALFMGPDARFYARVLVDGFQADVPPQPERKPIGPPHAHQDRPCTDACYEPAGDAAPAPRRAGLVDLIRQYGEECWAAGDKDEGNWTSRAEASSVLFDRIRALLGEQPAESGLLTLTLPVVPDGAVALVGKSTGWRYVRWPNTNHWHSQDPEGGTDPGNFGDLLWAEGSVTVEMAPPREPRVWPKLDVISHDVKAVRGASGKVYHQSHFSQSVPVFCEYGEDGRPTGRGHMFYALQTFDGPLEEVLSDGQ